MLDLLKYIEEANTIVLLGHERPDGDCVGATVGLYNYIIDNYEGKTVKIFLQDFNKDFLFLNGAELISHSVDDPMEIDLCISLDTASKERHREFLCYFERAKKTVCVDHHISNPGFCDESYIKEEACSACEAICDLIYHSKISKNAAEAFYMGIVHDTGVFKHNNTTPRAMELAGMMIELGAKPSYIIDQTFYKKTYVQNYIMGKALLDAKLYHDGKIIATILKKDFMDSCGATSIDCDGVVDQLRVTEGVSVAIFAYDVTDKEIKFSLRSNEDVDVSVIACSFNGGGHVKAAGFSYFGSFEDALSEIIPMIEASL